MSRRKLKTQELESFVEEVVETASQEIHPIKTEYTEDSFLSSGSTLLDLALSDREYGGYLLGSVVNIIGESHSGKSLSTLTAFAEANKRSLFDNYKFVLDEPESALNFPLEDMFGLKEERIEFIPEDRSQPRTIQEWEVSVLSYLQKKVGNTNKYKNNHSVIYVLDSWDGLTSLDMLNTERLGKGGFKTEKALVASSAFPKIVGRIKATKSLFLVLSQERDNVGGNPFEPKDVRSGGRALKFYATHEIWLKIGKKITRKVRKKDREVGMWVRCKISKNKVTGKRREISFPVMYDFGIDDVVSCIQWMVDEGFWEVENETIKAGTDFIDASERKLISHIEENNLEPQLRKVVSECWQALEDEIKVNRKKRYQ